MEISQVILIIFNAVLVSSLSMRHVPGASTPTNDFAVIFAEADAEIQQAALYDVTDPQEVIRRCFCSPGAEVVYRCTQQRSALCRACRPGYYSTAHDQLPCQRCQPCAAGMLEVSPCTATRQVVCLHKATLRVSCKLLSLSRQRGLLTQVTVGNWPSLTTAAITTKTTIQPVPPQERPNMKLLPAASLSQGDSPLLTSPPGIPLVPVVCGGFLLVFLVLVIFVGSRHARFLHSRVAVRRQAEYFHAASSCYQIDDPGDAARVEGPSAWYRCLISCVRHFTLGYEPYSYSPLETDGGLDERIWKSDGSDSDVVPSRGSVAKQGRHSVYCPAPPDKDVALDSNGFYKGNFSSEGGTLSHHTVAITISKLAIPEGANYTIKGKTHTDIPSWTQHVDVDHGSVIIAPIVECHVEGHFRLLEHVTVCVPHCIHDNRKLASITVYCGDTNQGEQFKQIAHMRQRASSCESFYSADDQYVYIHTCDFRLSQFICTIGDRQIALQLQELVFYEHHIREDSQELRLKVKLCDSRNMIPDLRQAYFDQEEMTMAESCSWRRLELPNNEVTSNSEVSIELRPGGNWQERIISELKFPLKMTHRLADVLDSRNNLLGEFILVRTGSTTKDFSGSLLLRLTEKIEEITDQSHTVLSEGPEGSIQKTRSSSHTIETTKSCHQQIPINIVFDPQMDQSRFPPVPLSFAFEYISSHLSAANFPSFYRKLGLTEGAVDAFRERHRDDFKEQKMQVLLDWQQRHGKMAVASELLSMLSDIGLRKFAEDLTLEATNSI